MNKISRGRKKLFLVLFIFMLPVIASGILFHYHTHFRLKTLNHGTLLSSLIDVQYLYAKMQGGEQKKWRVIYVSGNVCDVQCKQIDHQLRQVQKALGKDSNRVNTVWLGGKYAELAKLKGSFAQQGHPDFSTNNKIYLVDPLGNLFMYYSDDINPMNVLKDLKRVLEVSQIG